MKVLFTEHIEHYILGLSRELTKYVDLWILSTHRFDTPSKQIVLPNIRRIRGLLRIVSLKVLPKLFDVIHANNALNGLYSVTHDNLIVTEHGWPDPEFQHKSVQRYYIKERDALLHLHKIDVPIVTVSNYCAKMLHKKFGVKIHKIIYHGLVDEFRASEPKELAETRTPVILWVSRFVPAKEPMVLLNALEYLNNKLHFKAVLRGSGPLKKHMEEFIKKNGLTSKIIFKGKVPFRTLPDLYKSATILVHTSSYEPFGLCILEGMGAGVPVIVPKSGGAYEVAGPAAVHFIPHNPKDLAEKIMSLLLDPNSYHKQSRKSLERSQCFTWQEAAEEYLRTYRNLISHN